MSQSEETTLEEIPDQILIEHLMKKHGISATDIETLVQKQASQFLAAQEQISGTSFAIHPATRTLYIQDFLTQEVKATLPLYSGDEGLFDDPPAIDVQDWERWGTSLCYIHPEDGSIEHFAPVDQDHLYGLVMTADTSFLYTQTPFNTKILGVSYQCLYHRVHKSIAPNQAFDMYLSEDRQFLCISDRAQGRLIFISTVSHQELGQIHIRQPGSTKSINVTFEYYNPRAFITDNHSAKIFDLNIEDMTLVEVPLGKGGQIFGNLVPAPDIRYLFLLVLKPVASLLYVNIETWEFEEEIHLKGNCFSSQHIDPCDLMVMTPDQNHLLVVTSSSDPTPFTPVITVIDPHQFQVVHLHTIANALKDQTKPVALVFPWANPVFTLQKSPLELMLAQSLTTPESIEALKQEMRTAAEPKVTDAQEHVSLLEPQSAEKMVLDAEDAIPAIMTLLSQKLYQQNQVELKEHETERLRFLELAESYRVALENLDSVEILIENILDEHRLETLITRQDVLSLMVSSRPQQRVVRSPYYCPACQQELKGLWDCQTCGLELESPPRLLKKKRSSMSSLGALSKYHLLVSDAKNQRILILDDHKTIDWELKTEDLPHPTPWDALWINSQNILVVDKDQNQVYECGPGGKLNWALKQDAPELQLNQPVKATYFKEDLDAESADKNPEEHFLIVDQGNHRVLVVDHKHRLLWQYGIQGEAGSEAGFLNQPSDFQKTFDQTYLIADTGNDRVLEIRGDKIIRSFGPEQGLKKPVFAQRLYDHDTLIVDAGNYRVLEVDLDGEVISECFYFTDEMGEDMRIDHPIKAYRREKKSIVLMDQDKMLEIIPAQHKLIWSSLLVHLAKRLEIKRDAFDKRDSYIQSFDQHRMPTLEELISRLREDNRLGSSTGIAQQLFDNLNALVEQRRERDQQRIHTTNARIINEARVLNIPIYVVDRTNQQIVQIKRDASPVWSFGTDPQYKLLRPTHISESPDSIYIADTSHHRVLEVSKKTAEVLHIFGGTKAAQEDSPAQESCLSMPRSATRTLLGNTLICDQGNKRLVEFNPAGEIIWEFQHPHQISYPYFALELGKGTILFVDRALHMVKEINREGELIWAYGQSRRMGYAVNQLSGPEYACRLPSGSILIADTGNHRILEVSPGGKILWEFSQNKKFELNRPNFCQRLLNGNNLIAYNDYRNLLEVNREGDSCWFFELGHSPMVSMV